MAEANSNFQDVYKRQEEMLPLENTQGIVEQYKRGRTMAKEKIKVYTYTRVSTAMQDVYKRQGYGGTLVQEQDG